MTTGRPPKRLYSLREACIYLGRTEWAMRSLVKKGKIPVVNIDSRLQFALQDMLRLVGLSIGSDVD